jgi:hypothetical protein
VASRNRDVSDGGGCDAEGLVQGHYRKDAPSRGSGANAGGMNENMAQTINSPQW